jgi:hypothetical protein
MAAAYAGHNQPVRATASVALVVVMALLGACRRSDEPVTRPPDSFCEAAIDLEDGLENLVGINQQIRLVRRLVETAPAEIEADARTFLDALEAVRDDPDNPDLRDDSGVQEAVDNVNRFATDGCGLVEREGGGGSPL